MFALSMCTPVHAMDNQDCKYTKTVNQSEGEIVSSTVDYDCKTTPTVIVKESEPTVIYRTGTTVSSPVTTTRVVSSTPVYHNNQSNRTIEDLVNRSQKKYSFVVPKPKTFEVGNICLDFKRRDKGQCYYNYDKQGLDCY